MTDSTSVPETAPAADVATPVAAPAAAPPSSQGSHFLESEWVFWEHRAPEKKQANYEDNMKMIGEFATVEDFWNYYNHIPKPSQFFFDGKTAKKFADRKVEAFSLFKKGIKPEWEDPANRTGAEWFCRKHFATQQLDDFWQNLVLGMIGETIDPGDEICGARVVDKSVVEKQRVVYRLELWIRRKDQTAADELLARTQAALGKGSNTAACKWEFRPH